tara:strand:+ start:1094 stop:1363 length:270 start_codon:yes stop_codon:yes gene_type:complete
MKGVGRVGVDSAGGVIVGILAPNVSVNGSPIVLVGAAVTGHGIGPHAAPTMVGGSSTVFVNGIAVCRAGDAASCGHTLSAGSDNIFIGD